MKIEIYTSNRNGTTVSGLQTDFSGLINNSEDLISTLNTVKNTVFVISGGVGCLQNALSSVEQRIAQEEARKVALEKARSKTDKFIELAHSTDHTVAKAVSKNKDEFYHLNSWAKPQMDLSVIYNCYRNSLVWIKNSVKKLYEFIEYYRSIYNDSDYESMSVEELKNLYDYYKKLIESDEMSDEDNIRLQSFLMYLSEKGIHSNMSEDDLKKIELYNSLYELIYPDKAEKLKKIGSKYKNEKYPDNEIFAKYQIYTRFQKGRNVSEDFIDAQFTKAKELSKGMYIRLCEAQDSDLNIGSATSADEMSRKFSKGSRKCYCQGSTVIYDVENHKKEDGSVDLNFSLANGSKRYTEITVYDSNGKIVSREYMDGQKDPSSISGVIKEGGKMVKDLVDGKVFSADCSAYNSKKTYSLNIPAGGYVQITEDPNAMNYNSYKQNIINDISSETIDLSLDTADLKTGSAIGDFGVDMIKGLAKKAVSDEFKGKTATFEDYMEEAASTATNSTIKAVASAGKGNPAGIGIKALDIILKNNKRAESYLVKKQQNDSKGNGSLFIYT